MGRPVSTCWGGRAWKPVSNMLVTWGITFRQTFTHMQLMHLIHLCRFARPCNVMWEANPPCLFAANTAPARALQIINACRPANPRAQALALNSI